MDKDTFLIKFRVNEEREIKGVIVEDYERRGPFRRTKIVFLYGYRKEKYSEWNGRLPQDNEVWLCQGRTESKSLEVNKGCITVVLLFNVSDAKKDPSLKPVIQLLNDWFLIYLLDTVSSSLRLSFISNPMLPCYYVKAFEKFVEIDKNKNFFEIFANIDPPIFSKDIFKIFKAISQDKQVFINFIKSLKSNIFINFITILAGRGWTEEDFDLIYFKSMLIFQQDPTNDRYFKCPLCGALHKVSKAQRVLYRKGEQVRIICGSCCFPGKIFNQENLAKKKEKIILEKQVEVDVTEADFKKFANKLNHQNGKGRSS